MVCTGPERSERVRNGLYAHADKCRPGALTVNWRVSNDHAGIETAACENTPALYPPACESPCARHRWLRFLGLRAGPCPTHPETPGAYFIF